jgi:hypothetical protein
VFYGIEKIIEERILKAQKRGDFDNLEGAGKPIRTEDDRHIPEDVRIVYKILKNADCLPPEIEMKKEIKRTEDLLVSLKDTAEKYRVLKKLNFLILKLNSLRPSFAAMDIPQHYLLDVTERMSSKAFSR